MTADDLRAVAHRLVEKMVTERPGEAAVVASLVLSELLEATLFADDNEAAVDDFVQALNSRLHEIAIRRRAPTSWALTPARRPHRH
jgi:hypothetical protein